MNFLLIKLVQGYIITNRYNYLRDPLYPFEPAFPYDYPPFPYTDYDVGMRHLASERRFVNSFPLHENDKLN